MSNTEQEKQPPNENIEKSEEEKKEKREQMKKHELAGPKTVAEQEQSTLAQQKIEQDQCNGKGQSKEEKEEGKENPDCAKN